MQFGNFPRVKVAALPTPFEEMTGLRAALGAAPRLFIKRDDNTGLAVGGNKARKLEFLMAEAQARHADIVLTTGGPQSNHARMTAAFALKLGMKPILVFDGADPGHRQGNLLLDTIMGAELVFAGEGADTAAEMEKIADKLAKQGHTPYIVPLGGSNPLGALGYLGAMYETIGQANERGMVINHLFVASGSGGTQAGLVLGARLTGGKTVVHGVSVSRPARSLAERVAGIATGTARLIGLDTVITPDDVTVHDEYVGPGYGIATPGCLEAIKLLARTEGIFLDPVYTGKAMAALIDKTRKGEFKQGENIVFCHTGGSPALFAQSQHFQASQEV